MNVFTVEPGRQAALVDLLADATIAVINRFPGYVSANIHRSLDGTKVVNYAQWCRVEDYEALLADPLRNNTSPGPRRALERVSYISHASPQLGTRAKEGS